METDESKGVVNGKDEEIMVNHKKKFLMFCEVVLHHERELLSETLNSSQESINESRVADGQNNDSIENSTFNSDSDGGANGELAAYAGVVEDGGGAGDSFNSVTCFCGKPFAGRPMIECSGCLTWLHMSCAKVKRKNIPEFYYCDNCKGRGRLLSSPGITTASSGEEAPQLQNGISTLSSNGDLITTKPRKPKIKIGSSDSIKNSDSKKSQMNGKLKKIRQKMSSPKKSTKVAISSLPTVSSLTELSLNPQVENPQQQLQLQQQQQLKSPIATNNNNNIYIETTQQQKQQTDSENGGDSPEKYNKRVKLL